MTDANDELLVEHHEKVAWVYFNRPKKGNAVHPHLLESMGATLRELALDPQVRCVVLAAKGSMFCSGIDLTALQDVAEMDEGDLAPHRRANLLLHVQPWQDAVDAIERCRKPVIAAVQGACIGAGLDLVAAADIRLASADAFFSLREAAMAMVSDLGSLQRLPHIIGQGLTREMAFTARDVSAEEALRMHLVNRVVPNHEQLAEQARQLAEDIARQPSLAVQASKDVLNRSRGMSVQDGMHYALVRNSAILPSADLRDALTAFRQKRQPATPSRE